MLRRTALLTFSAATAPLVVGAATGGVVPAAGAASAELSASAYERMTLMIGTLAILTSRVEQQRGANAEVKEFGRIEIDEQTTVARVLTDLENPPLAPLSPEQRQALAALKRLSGAALDRQFVLDQILGHTELLRVQRAYIRTGNVRDLLHIAKLNESRIEEHLDDLAELRALVGA